MEAGFKATGGAVVVTAWLLAAAVQAAPPCDPSLRPIAGHIGYQVRERRCEGFYVSPVSAPGIELLAFLRGRLQFTLKAGERLRLAAPGYGGALRVRTVALSPRTYYRMDAALPPGGRLDWPVDSVLRPSGLGPGDIGVLGWFEEGGAKVFVPVRVTSRSAPPGDGGALRLIVRSAVDVERYYWRVYPARGRPGEYLPGPKNRRAGQPVVLELPPGESGRLRVEVAAKVKNRDQWATLQLVALRPPP
ncbi:MAG TPA: hypothetical protein ENJ19_07475 [Gammaproteobacteria bacterium]|nr:hypothetical protein [Gammaproteobacteria bacterium]